MNQEGQTLPQLSLQRIAIVGDNAFDGDKLGRKELGERLTGYIDRLREGSVLAIDAPWGEGKTWFGRNWAKHLKEKEHKVVFIDAFEQDYMEDPFLLITAEIAAMLDDDQGAANVFRKKAAGVIQALLPMSAKILFNLAGRVAIGSADLSGELAAIAQEASSGVADVTGNWVEEKLEEYAQEKGVIETFRQELTDFAARQEKPIVIFIDELDRCRPSFAVQLIERLKHFFDVPNLVFVLLLNRDQLEKAVKGVYGVDTDATVYLGKFVNFFFMLPKKSSKAHNVDSHIGSYISYVLSRYDFNGNRGLSLFKDTFTTLASAFNLSLRDVERAIALFAFAQPFDTPTHFIAYAITIKIIKPQLFKDLSLGETKAHIEAQKDICIIIENLEADKIKVPRIIRLLLAWHTGYIDGFKVDNDNLIQINQFLYHCDVEISNLFPFLASRIDLHIEG